LSLEHEKGRSTSALRCVVNDDLRQEWTKYLDQTKTHVKVMTDVCEQVAEQSTPGCEIIRLIGGTLVQAMEKALKGKPEAAQLVACECVVLAETKDHLDWELIGKCAEQLSGEQAKALKAAFEEIEEEEDEHLCHSKG
jgi:hypothetical protein